MNIFFFHYTYHHMTRMREPAYIAEFGDQNFLSVKIVTGGSGMPSVNASANAWLFRLRLVSLHTEA